eukprot:SAG31_NODE_6909_length_1854_cov_1.378917_3_plen_202_part_00
MQDRVIGLLTIVSRCDELHKSMCWTSRVFVHLSPSLQVTVSGERFLAILKEFQRSQPSGITANAVEAGLPERHLRIFGMDEKSAVVYSRSPAVFAASSPAMKAATSQSNELDKDPLNLHSTSEAESATANLRTALDITNETAATSERKKAKVAVQRWLAARGYSEMRIDQMIGALVAAEYPSDQVWLYFSIVFSHLVHYKS